LRQSLNSLFITRTCVASHSCDGLGSIFESRSGISQDISFLVLAGRCCLKDCIEAGLAGKLRVLVQIVNIDF